MRIDAYNQINSYYKQTTRKAAAKNSYSQGTTDQVSFSSIGRDMQTAKSALAGTADVRADKVADLKARIEAGTYNVSGESFADKILSAYYM